MVPIPGGTFTMGCIREDLYGGCLEEEKPLHNVIISAFSMGKYEVTVEEYLVFVDDTGKNYPQWMEPENEYNVETGTNSFYKNKGYSRAAKKLPIVGISWNDAVAYCAWLSKKTGLNYRLPTEAEWEYAARGGAEGAKDEFLYSGSDNIEEVAWYYENSDRRTHPIGQKKQNQLDLYDMSGNVWEWCADVWHDDYNGAPSNGSAWISDGYASLRVPRGGSWSSGPEICRVAFRSKGSKVSRGDFYGFRVARD